MQPEPIVPGGAGPGLLDAWWCFVRLGTAKAGPRLEALAATLGLSTGAAVGCKIASLFADLGLCLSVVFAFGSFWRDHGVLFGRGAGNLVGMAVIVGTLLLGHLLLGHLLVTTPVITLIWSWGRPEGTGPRR
jgi:hypothetical protein